MVAVTTTEQRLRIEPIAYTDPVAQRLIKAALADLAERYGDDEGDATPVQPDEFTPPNGIFLVAWRNDEPVGCGGWRSHEGTAAEIKRMYTVPEARGQGVARSVLAALEETARQAGKRRMVLETGNRQPEAIRLYQTSGYQRIPDFGYYKGVPGVLSFGKDL